METTVKDVSNNKVLLKRHSTFKYIERNLKMLFQILVIIIVELFNSCIDFFKTVEPKKIEGQLALVTGGGNGLGKEICIELAKLGCNVAVVDIDLAGALKTSEILTKQYGVQSHAYKADVSVYKEIEELKSKIENDIGTVDILFNNAGLTPTKTIFEYSPEYLQKLVDVNFMSNIWTVKVFLPGMKDRKRGHVVQIASIAGLSGVPISIAYSGTKFAVRGFMEALAIDLITEDLEDIIHTTTVYPYFIATNEELCTFLEKNRNLDLLPAFSSSYVARKTMEGFLKNNQKVVIPWFFEKVLESLRFYPRRAVIRIHKLLMKGARMYKENLKKISNSNGIDNKQSVADVTALTTKIEENTSNTTYEITRTLLKESEEKVEKAVEQVAEKFVDHALGRVVENVVGKVVDNVTEI